MVRKLVDFLISRTVNLVGRGCFYSALGDRNRIAKLGTEGHKLSNADLYPISELVSDELPGFHPGERFDESEIARRNMVLNRRLEYDDLVVGVSCLHKKTRVQSVWHDVVCGGLRHFKVVGLVSKGLALEFDAAHDMRLDLRSGEVREFFSLLEGEVYWVLNFASL